MDERTAYCESSCGERQRLAVVGKHVFHVDGVGTDMHDFITAVDNVTFAGDKDVLALQQEDALVAVLGPGKAVELEIDRRRWRLWRHVVRLLLRRQRCRDR